MSSKPDQRGSARQQHVLGQQAIDETTNEIKAIPLLLDRLALNGALVTIEAMGTQKETAEQIGDGGDYCLALKENHPLLHAEVARFFADPQAAVAETHTTVDGDHGRIEERRHVVCHDVDWLLSDRRYADEPRFPHLAMIGMVEASVRRGDTASTQRSAPPRPRRASRCAARRQPGAPPTSPASSAARPESLRAIPLDSPPFMHDVRPLAPALATIGVAISHMAARPLRPWPAGTAPFGVWSLSRFRYIWATDR